ncbi:hypothetical protein CASFOL_004591 [Castilleja foliolosa]|uniref:Uncharacterized protein n=1 Tax=Castilleja foliolosa TaxID=1961234 RepID=A0ABD3EEZ4_9LAMI
MLSKSPVIKTYPNFFPCNHKKLIFKVVCCEKNVSSSSSSDSPSDNKSGFKLVGQALGDKNWKLGDIDANWLSKTQSFFNEVTSPFIKSVNDRRSNTLHYETEDVEDMLVTEQTVDSRTPNGELSEAAIVSIEQFSKMNGF